MRRLLLALVLSALIPSVAQGRYLHQDRATIAVIDSHAAGIRGNWYTGASIAHIQRANGHSVYAWVRIAGVPIIVNGAPLVTTLSVVEHVVLRRGVLTVRIINYDGVYRERL